MGEGFDGQYKCTVVFRENEKFLCTISIIYYLRKRGTRIEIEYMRHSNCTEFTQRKWEIENNNNKQEAFGDSAFFLLIHTLSSSSSSSSSASIHLTMFELCTFMRLYCRTCHSSLDTMTMTMRRLKSIKRRHKFDIIIIIIKIIMCAMRCDVMRKHWFSFRSPSFEFLFCCLTSAHHVLYTMYVRLCVVHC